MGCGPEREKALSRTIAGLCGASLELLRFGHADFKRPIEQCVLRGLTSVSVRFYGTTFFPRRNGQNPGIRLVGHRRSPQGSRQRGNEQACPRKCNQRRSRQGPSLPRPIYVELSSRPALRSASSKATSVSMVSYPVLKCELRPSSSTPPLVIQRVEATDYLYSLGRQEVRHRGEWPQISVGARRKG